MWAAAGRDAVSKRHAWAVGRDDFVEVLLMEQLGYTSPTDL